MILEMGHLCRLDFAVGSAGRMRQALSLALRRCETREAFGRRLAELPMQRVRLLPPGVDAAAIVRRASLGLS